MKALLLAEAKRYEQTIKKIMFCRESISK